MQNGGAALMGTGIGRGENRALEAAQQAISSPLLDNVSIAGATGRADQHHRRRRPDPRRDHPDQRHHPRRRGRRRRDHLRRGQRSRHARRGPGHGHRDRLRPRRHRRQPTDARPGRGRRAQLPAAQRHAAVDAGGWPRPCRRRRSPCTRSRRRRGVSQAPPSRRRPKCPRWKSRPSSGGRWTDAGSPAGCRRRGRSRRRRRSRPTWVVAVAPHASSRRLPRPPPAPAATPTAIEIARHAAARRDGLRSLRPPRGRRRSTSAARPCAAARSPPDAARVSVFSFRATAPDTCPTRISVRTSPEQRVDLPPGRRWLERRGRADRAGPPSRCASTARSTTRSTRRSTRRSPTTSSTAPTASGSPGTSPTSTPGRSTSPATSSRATASRWCFERLVSEDGEIRFGRVLASDLTMSGKSLTAFRFEADGRPALLRCRRQLAPPRLPPGAGRVPPDLLQLRARAGSTRCSASPDGTRAPTTRRRPARR